MDIKMKSVTLNWSDVDDHEVTVGGVHIYSENYGADADGNRGRMTDFVEYTSVSAKPPISTEEQAAWEKFVEGDGLEELLYKEVMEICEAKRAAAMEAAMDARYDEKW